MSHVKDTSRSKRGALKSRLNIDKIVFGLNRILKIPRFGEDAPWWTISGMSDNATTDVSSYAIASMFLDCLISYKRLYFLLVGHQAQGAENIDVSELADNYGRLNLWGNDSGALRTGRGSLDDNLRTEDKLRSILLDILRELKETIDMGYLHLTQQSMDSGVPSVPENESISLGVSSALEDYDQGSSSTTGTASVLSDDVTGDHSERASVQGLILAICEYTACLYKLSRSLRRVTVHEKYIRSVSKDIDLSPFAPYDQDHIRNKFPTASHTLIRRLGRANTRRRQQLKYWEEHPQTQGQEFSSVPYAERSKNIPQEASLAKLSTTAPSISMPSKISYQSFTTVAQSVLRDDTSHLGQRNTVYAPTRFGKNANLRIPNIPIVPADQLSFECPYCHVQLDKMDMNQRTLWK
ncbi:MAG: hypothetical protein Q9215_004309 [Flavoplaca cf. flavocitrina]